MNTIRDSTKYFFLNNLNFSVGLQAKQAIGLHDTYLKILIIDGNELCLGISTTFTIQYITLEIEKAEDRILEAKGNREGRK